MTELDAWLCVALVAFIFVWPTACQIVYLRRRRGRVWWELNRVRAAIAVEKDPGPWSTT